MPETQHTSLCDTRRGAWSVVALLTLGLVATPAVRAQGEACAEGGCGAGCQQRLGVTRRLTARYLQESAALSDGYLSTSECVAIPGVGAMGLHYVNPARMQDLEVNIREPEILLYLPQPDGRRRLVAVEYYAPALSNGAPWFGGAAEPPPVVDNPPPILFGKTFDGPMPGHEPGQPWHYDLHVWAWDHNPSGIFAQFNPRLSCP